MSNCWNTQDSIVKYHQEIWYILQKIAKFQRYIDNCTSIFFVQNINRTVLTVFRNIVRQCTQMSDTARERFISPLLYSCRYIWLGGVRIYIDGCIYMLWKPTPRYTWRSISYENGVLDRLLTSIYTDLHMGSCRKQESGARPPGDPSLQVDLMSVPRWDPWPCTMQLY